MNKVAAFLLIGMGSLLVLFSLGVSAAGWVRDHPTAAPLPGSVAGLPLSVQTTGRPATAEFTRLHEQEFLLTSGAIGVYGSDRRVTLWVAGAPLKWMATRMVVSMREKLALGNTPFLPTGDRRDAERTVYALDGMGQNHFYFPSGKRVVWLAADEEIAETALQQVLQFYP